MALRLAFLGTPEFSVPTLFALHEAGREIAAVYTQPPRPAGRRGLELVPSPVQREAERLGLAVRSPPNLKAEADRQAFRALELDAAVVVAYGQILPQAVLDAPRLGCFNGHASLLPRWRGAAPIQRAVMAGDTQTGMTVMRMEAGLDTGPAGPVETLAIGADETAGELHDRLARLCAGLMVRAMAELEAGTLRFAPQPAEGVTYAAKIDKAETRIDWALAATQIHDRIRGLSPFPGAWCPMPGGKDGERLKLLGSALVPGQAGRPGEVLDERLTVACGTGAVRLPEVQRAGGKPVPAAEFLRGARLRPGDMLS